LASAPIQSIITRDDARITGLFAGRHAERASRDLGGAGVFVVIRARRVLLLRVAGHRLLAAAGPAVRRLRLRDVTRGAPAVEPEFACSAAGPD